MIHLTPEEWDEIYHAVSATKQAVKEIRGSKRWLAHLQGILDKIGRYLKEEAQNGREKGN